MLAMFFQVPCHQLSIIVPLKTRQNKHFDAGMEEELETAWSQCYLCLSQEYFFQVGYSYFIFNDVTFIVKN